jgi:hypothetical protein
MTWPGTSFKKEDPGLGKARILRSEVRMGRSRFDFLLQEKGEEILLEVKSCTLVGNKAAMFPDAVTERGTRHLEELARLVVKHGLSVLSDEAYFDTRYSGEAMSIASLPGMAERTVILYTFGKKLRMPHGWDNHRWY